MKDQMFRGCLSTWSWKKTSLMFMTSCPTLYQTQLPSPWHLIMLALSAKSWWLLIVVSRICPAILCIPTTMKLKEMVCFNSSLRCWYLLQPRDPHLFGLPTWNIPEWIWPDAMHTLPCNCWSSRSDCGSWCPECCWLQRYGLLLFYILICNTIWTS